MAMVGGLVLKPEKLKVKFVV